MDRKMDLRSRSPDSPSSRRHRRRRRSRSFSRSRSRDRSRERRRRYSRSTSKDRSCRRTVGDNDYRDEQDLSNDRDFRSYRHDGRRDRRDRDRNYHRNRGYSSDSSNDSYYGQNLNKDHYKTQTPSKKIIILGLAKHLTETDINNELVQVNFQPTSIRLIRKRKTGASRGFAFVEFNTDEEASRWMEYKQGLLVLQNQYRAVMQYSVAKESSGRDRIPTDWYCAKCGVFNFKRRENCFKCNASREESEKGGEGSDEVSSILTKKIMLRNLDVLTNEEGVLTVMQEVIPTLVSKISKILICRDPLTSTSRGICYLVFENLVDSMNTHNALKSLEPPLSIDGREINISYCVDVESRQLHGRSNGNKGHDGNYGGKGSSNYQYTLNDVPRLAEYSAGVYAQTKAEHDFYFKYYTDYYTEQINNGLFADLPTMSQIGGTANSGAAVALSAIQRKQKQQFNNKATVAPTPASPTQIPNGDVTKKYPSPDTTQYQYEESSGYYFDPSTGLYYDASSQYYYNSEIAAYLYWDPAQCTYLLASSDTASSTMAEGTNSVDPMMSSVATAPAAVIPTMPTTANVVNDKPTESKAKEEKPGKQDKVKVAKKIVKDMEKWAKQLNQKKEMSMMMPVQPAMTSATQPPRDDIIPTTKVQSLQPLSSGYADVGFAILENRDTRQKNDASSAAKTLTALASDSDTETEPANSSFDKNLINVENLTCLLCKRAFQSLDILTKHVKLSNLHKENLQKYKAQQKIDHQNSIQYRDRAKERRQKYVESEPPPVNRVRERFEAEFQKQTTQMQKRASDNLAATPIGQSNLGNRMLQKMGWTEGQGLGRSNQGRTNIIEAEARAPTAGLGSASAAFVPGDDYRTHIKRMMRMRYEQAE